MKCVYPLPPNPRANRVDVQFLDPNYPRWRVSMGLPPDEHPGIDLNVAGTAGDKDLNYPIVAMLPGEVIHAREHRVWGRVVVVRHYPHVARAFGHSKLFTQYAHLNAILVTLGQDVEAGEVIGTMGKGEAGRFISHLHFEIRIEQLDGDFWPGTDRNLIRRFYLDPLRFLQTHANYRRRLVFERGRIYRGSNPPENAENIRVVLRGPEVDIGL